MNFTPADYVPPLPALVAWHLLICRLPIELLDSVQGLHICWMQAIIEHFQILTIPPGGQVECLFNREAMHGGKIQRKPRLPRMTPFNYLVRT